MTQRLKMADPPNYSAPLQEGTCMYSGQKVWDVHINKVICGCAVM